MPRHSALHSTLIAPQKAKNIPAGSQWLSGEGAGSWFHLEPAGQEFKVTRYNPDGRTECSGLFRIANRVNFDMGSPYRFVHLSHCKTITLEQQKNIIKMERTGPF